MIRLSIDDRATRTLPFKPIRTSIFLLMLWAALGIQRPAAYDFNVYHETSRIPDTSQIRYRDLDVSSLSAVDQNNVWAVANVLGFQTISTQPGVNSADH